MRLLLADSDIQTLLAKKPVETKPRFKWVKETNEDGFEINVEDVKSGDHVGNIAVVHEYDPRNSMLSPYEDQPFFEKIADYEMMTDIRSLDVEPKYRGQGVAKYIYNLALQEIKKVWPEDPVAINASPMGNRGLDLDGLIAFYQKAGFKLMKRYDQHSNALLFLDSPKKIKTVSELELVEAASNPAGWIAPDGKWHDTGESHFLNIARLAFQEEMDEIEEEFPDEDVDMDTLREFANRAYNDGWVSVGHAGDVNVAGLNKVFNDIRNPVIQTIQKIFKDNPSDKIYVEGLGGADKTLKGEYDLPRFLKSGRWVKYKNQMTADIDPDDLAKMRRFTNWQKPTYQEFLNEMEGEEGSYLKYLDLPALYETGKVVDVTPDIMTKLLSQMEEIVNPEWLMDPGSVPEAGRENERGGKWRYDHTHHREGEVLERFEKNQPVWMPLVGLYNGKQYLPTGGRHRISYAKALDIPLKIFVIDGDILSKAVDQSFKKVAEGKVAKDFKTADLYRGIKGHSFHDIDPLYRGDGVFGWGTYYAMQAGVSRDYLDDEHWGWMLKYEFKFKKPISFHSPEQIDLHYTDHGVEPLTDQKLCDLIQDEEGCEIDTSSMGQDLGEIGIDAIYLMGRVDGGPQVLIPPNANPTYKMQAASLFLRADDLIQSIESLLQTTATPDPKDRGMYFFPSIPLDRMDDVQAVLTEWEDSGRGFEELHGATETEAAVGHYYHGTSSTAAEKIMQVGFTQAPEQKVWDSGTSMESFSGTYFSTNFLTALSSGRNAVQKMGGVVAVFEVQIEKTTGLFDEDEFRSPLYSLDKSSGFLINEYYAKRYKETPADSEDFPAVKKYIEDGAEFYLDKELAAHLGVELSDADKTKLRPLVIEWCWAVIDQIVELGREGSKRIPAYRKAMDSVIRTLKGLPDRADKMNIRIDEPIGFDGVNHITSLTLFPNYLKHDSGTPYVLKPVYGEPSADLLKQFDERIGGERVLGGAKGDWKAEGYQLHTVNLENAKDWPLFEKALASGMQGGAYIVDTAHKKANDGAEASWVAAKDLLKHKAALLDGSWQLDGMAPIVIATDRAGNFAGGVVADSTPEILNSFVLPQHQRKGLASALYDKLEELTGDTVTPGGSQSPDAKEFWKTRYKNHSESSVEAKIAPTHPLIKEADKYIKSSSFKNNYGDRMLHLLEKEFDETVDIETDDDMNKPMKELLAIYKKVRAQWQKEVVPKGNGIVLWRAITVDKTELDSFLKKIKENSWREESGHEYLDRFTGAGTAWAWSKKDANTYWSGVYDGHRVLMEAVVPIDSINLEDTVMLNLMGNGGGEREIRLLADHDLTIEKVFVDDKEVMKGAFKTNSDYVGPAGNPNQPQVVPYVTHPMDDPFLSLSDTDEYESYDVDWVELADSITQWVDDSDAEAFHHLAWISKSLPEDLRTCGDEVYRGHSGTKEGFEKLQAGSKLKLKSGSWSIDDKEAAKFALGGSNDYRSNTFKAVLKVTPNTEQVMLNLQEAVNHPMLTERLDDWTKQRIQDEGEVLLNEVTISKENLVPLKPLAEELGMETSYEDLFKAGQVSAAQQKGKWKKTMNVKQMADYWYDMAYGDWESEPNADDEPWYNQRLEGVADKWELKTLPIDSVTGHHAGHDASKEYIEDYKKMHESGGTEFPPLIVEPDPKRKGRWKTIDGQHRLKAQKELGKRDVLAYVPVLAKDKKAAAGWPEFDSKLPYDTHPLDDPNAKVDGPVLGKSVSTVELEKIARWYMSNIFKTKDMPMPEFAIADALTATWLGRCEMTYQRKVPLVRLQKSILDDPKTLDRILAHELIHVWQFTRPPIKEYYDRAREMKGLVPRDEGLKWKRLVNGITGHGENFDEWAAKINAIKGKDYVSEISDATYEVSESGKEFYILIDKRPSNGGQIYGYNTFVRPTPKIRDAIKFNTERYQARLFKETSKRWLGSESLKLYGGAYVPKKPEDQAWLKEKYEKGTPVTASVVTSAAQFKNAVPEWNGKSPLKNGIWLDGNIYPLDTTPLDWVRDNLNVPEPELSDAIADEATVTLPDDFFRVYKPMIVEDLLFTLYDMNKADQFQDFALKIMLQRKPLPSSFTYQTIQPVKKKEVLVQDFMKKGKLSLSARESDYTDEQFLEIITKVAKRMGFEDPGMAYMQCNYFSEAVKEMADMYGIRAELWYADAVAAHDFKEIEKGKVVPHLFVQIGKTVYDFTARQIDPDSDFPAINPQYKNARRVKHDNSGEPVKQVRRYMDEIFKDMGGEEEPVESSAIDWSTLKTLEEMKQALLGKLNVDFHTVMCDAEDIEPADIQMQFNDVQMMVPQDAVFDKHPYKDHLEDGRENEPHVTVLFGLEHAEDMAAISAHVAELPPLEFTIGEISAFRNEDKPYDVLKIAIDSPNMKDLHYWIRDNFDNDCKFEFNGHMTLAYIKKGTCESLEGPCEWTGATYQCGTLAFSHKTDGITKMPMAGREAVEAAKDQTIWYHLTDNAKFKLDSAYFPEDNAVAIEDRSGIPGIYLTPDVEKWVNGHGYWRPFVVEFKVDPSVKNDSGIHGRYGGEMFVPAASFGKLSIQRVIPLDAYAREEFGCYGWIEENLGTEFDTGKSITTKETYPFRGYHYSGPDVRDMSPTETSRLKNQLKEVKGAIHIEAKSPFDSKFSRWYKNWGDDQGLRIALGLDPYGDEPVEKEQAQGWFERRGRQVERMLKEATKGSKVSVYRCMKVDSGWLAKLQAGEIERLGSHWTIDRDLAPNLCGGHGGRIKEGNVVLEGTVPKEKLDPMDAFNPGWADEWEEFEVGVAAVDLVCVWNQDMSEVLWKPKKAMRMVAAEDEFQDEGHVRGKWGSQASGILFKCGPRILLLKRAHWTLDPLMWGVPGGAVPVDKAGKPKDIKKSAVQEVTEEIGGMPEGFEWKGEVVFTDGTFKYTTFLAEVPEEFDPILNDEHTDYEWVDADAGSLPVDVHPGVKWALEQFKQKQQIIGALIYDDMSLPPDIEPPLHHVGEHNWPEGEWETDENNYRLNNAQDVWYAVEDGQVVGHLGLNSDGWVESVYVDSDHRGEGIAIQLYEEAVKIMEVIHSDPMAQEAGGTAIWDKLEQKYPGQVKKSKKQWDFFAEPQYDDEEE